MADRSAQLSDLVRRYATLIRATVAKVAGRRDDDLGDEIVQRIAESLWKRLDEETVIDRPVSYLYRCAVRETVRELGRRFPDAAEPIEGAAEALVVGDPEQTLRAGELAAATEACFAAMSDERAAAARAHVAGFDVDEIMAMYHWPYQKARNLIARGLADLRAGLRARGYP